MALKNSPKFKTMKTSLSLFLFFLLILTKSIAQKYDFEYDSVGTKVAIKDVQSGKLISNYLYDDVEIYDQVGIVRLGKKYGIFDVNTAKTYCCDFDLIDEFDDLHYKGVKAIVKSRGKYGLIGLSKEIANLDIILPIKYKRIALSYDCNFLYLFQKGKKYGIFNLKNRKFVVPCIIESLSGVDLINDLLVIKNNKGKFGIYNLEAKELLIPKYESIALIDTSAHVFEVRLGKKSSIYDAKIEKFLVEPIEGILEINNFDNRFYMLRDEYRLNFVDTKTGKPLLAKDYNFSGWLNKNRYMSVEYKGKYGIFDFKELKLVVNCKYDDEHVIYDKERQYFD